MEIFSVIGMIITSFYFLLGLIFIAAVLDHKDHERWAGLITISGLIIFGSALDLSLGNIAIMVGVYLPIGFVWSFVKWKLYLNKIILNIKRKGDSQAEQVASKTSAPGDAIRKPSKIILTESEMRVIKNKGNFYKNIDVIMLSIFSWPSSFIGTICSDLLDVVEQFIRSHLVNIYSRISATAMLEIESITTVVKDEPKHEPENAGDKNQ